MTDRKAARSTPWSNASGRHNTAVGYVALGSNVDGIDNVAIGHSAMYENQSGNWNTGVGVDAIPGVDTGSGNTGVGGEAGYTENMANQNVSASLVVNGNALNTTGVWGVYSGERLKTDVADYAAGLDVVRQLHPVTFRYNGLEGLSSDETQIGLIAQSVEAVAP